MDISFDAYPNLSFSVDALYLCLFIIIDHDIQRLYSKLLNMVMVLS